MKKILILSILIYLQACECNTGDDIGPIDYTGISISVFNSLGQDMLAWGGNYHEDSTFILNTMGDSLYMGPNPLDGRVFFRPLKNRDFEIGELQLDTFYMHLYTNILDVDTMIFEYFIRNGKCIEEFTNQTFYYNNEIYFEFNRPDDGGFSVDVTKF